MEPLLHPFYPQNVPIPNYKPNDTSTVRLLAVFFSVVGAIFASAVVTVSKRVNVLGWNKAIFVWFVMCGFIHTFFEGYFGAFHQTLAGDNGLFAQLWKEYALADSRYLVSDPTVLYIERITSFIEGPLCFLLARSILHDASYRYPLQICISLGQLYGTILYFSTTIHEGVPHCDPRPYYVWFYFVFMNAWWVLVPTLLIRQSFTAMTNGMAFAKQYAHIPKSKAVLLSEKEQ